MSEPRPPIVAGGRFSLLHLVIFTSGCCVLFGILAAFGVGWRDTLIGFLVIGGVSGLTIACVALGQIRVRRRRAEEHDLTPFEADLLQYASPRRASPGGNPFRGDIMPTHLPPTGAKPIDPPHPLDG